MKSKDTPWAMFDEYDSYDPDDQPLTPTPSPAHDYPHPVLSQRLTWQQAARLQPEPFEDPALEAMTGHRFLVDLNTPDRTRYDADVAPVLTWLRNGHSLPTTFTIFSEQESDPGDQS